MEYDERVWLHFYEEGVPYTLEYPRMPLYGFLEQAAADFPENRALSYLGRDISYAELDTLVNRAANAFARLGLEPGDRVALYLANTPQFIISLYGALKIGAIVVPINPLLTAEEVAYELSDSGARALVVMSRFYPIIRQIRERTQLETVIVTNVKSYFPWPKRLLFTLFKEGSDRVRIENGDHELETLMQESDARWNAAAVDCDATALLQYTSGTTGAPKGVMLSHYNLVVNALQCRRWVVDTVDGEERVLGWLPFFHSFGMTACLGFTLSCAGTLVLIPDPHDLEYILKTIEAERITMLPGVPTMYAALGRFEKTPDYNLGSIRACISGGAPLLESVKARFVALTGAKLVEGYGLSEASPVTHANPINGVNKADSIGIPMPDTLCRVVDFESGEHDVPVGEAGELIVKAPQVMQGYWHPEEQGEAALRDGWLYTGDIVTMDRSGYFRVIDRKKDIIIVNGFNVSPTEVEKAICRHPKVEEAAAVGFPSTHSGEEVRAFAVLKAGEKLDEQELLAFLDQKLASFKMPRAIIFVDSLPKNVMGKLLRRLLVEREAAPWES